MEKEGQMGGGGGGGGGIGDWRATFYWYLRPWPEVHTGPQPILGSCHPHLHVRIIEQPFCARTDQLHFQLKLCIEMNMI